MATYIELVSWTDQGVRTAKDTCNRAKAFEESAGAIGVKVKSLFWTLGEYDLVITVEAPDDEAVTRINLMLAGQGNVRTRTLRAFNAEEMARITAGLK
ncbi:MAG TPA: GYD domain-containing protein [Paraburkholderia sp.]|nr:GYD domain-containing protein [Paraburkholderia sp.]